MRRDEGCGPFELLADDAAHFGIDRLVRRGAGVAASATAAPRYCRRWPAYRTDPSLLAHAEFRDHAPGELRRTLNVVDSRRC